MSEPPKVKKKVQFIDDGHGVVYLQRPTTGWLSGWARHIWIESHLEAKACIASPEVWDRLSQKYPIQEIIEYEDDQVEIRSIRVSELMP